jgi:hypothetical protein
LLNSCQRNPWASTPLRTQGCWWPATESHQPYQKDQSMIYFYIYCRLIHYNPKTHYLITKRSINKNATLWNIIFPNVEISESCVSAWRILPHTYIRPSTLIESILFIYLIFPNDPDSSQLIIRIQAQEHILWAKI